MNIIEHIDAYFEEHGHRFFSLSPGEWQQLKAELAKVREDAWQPIETAPTDGTIIDVWLGNINYEDADHAFYVGVPDCKRSPNWHFINGKFRPFAFGQALPIFVEPTHWTPRPAEPIRALKDGE